MYKKSRPSDGAAFFIKNTVSLHLMKLKGLILLGGESTRMQQPKHLIEYHNQAQFQYLNDLLLLYCEEVFFSSNLEQTFYSNPSKNLHDLSKYKGHGPISGLLSALEQTQSPLLVLPCDMPFISTDTIEHLFEKRDISSLATVYKNPTTGFTEPLLGIYELPILSPLQQWFEEGNYSLRKFIDSQRASYVTPGSNLELFSANTPEEMEEALLILKSMR